MKKHTGWVRDIYIDTNVTHLEERWWHKFIFWKEYIYPKWVIKTKRVSIQSLKSVNKRK